MDSGRDNRPAKLLEGIALHRRGDLAAAERAYEQALREAPKSFDAAYLLGMTAVQTSRVERGIEFIRRAIAIDDRVAAAHLNLGNALSGLGRHAEALASYDRALALEPNNPETHYNRANSLAELKRFDGALIGYNAAIALKPDFAEAFVNRGVALAAVRRFDDALASYDSAIALRPREAKLHFSRGLALAELRRSGEAAAAAFDQAIALDPQYAQAFAGRGMALAALGQLDDALRSYDAAIALNPEFAEAFANRANVLRAAKRLEEALAGLDRAIALRPNQATLHFNRGAVLMDLRNAEQALAEYDAAIALNPAYAEAYNNRGLALMDLHRPEDALASYNHAIRQDPQLAEAHGNRGNVLTVLQRMDEALASYDRAIELKPDDASLRYNPGRLLSDAKRLADALASYDSAMAINPDLPGVEGDRLYTKLQICDWYNFDAEAAHLLGSIRDGKPNAQPFAFLAIPASAEDQAHCASLWAAHKDVTVQKPVSTGVAQRRHDRIRIGYLSADFRDHPVAQLIAGLIERHDRSRFQIAGFSFGIDDGSEMRKRLSSAFDEFHDVQRRSDRETAELLRARDINIAVDLTGHTRSGRIGIFTQRPAPIQVNYLGYPGTMGSPAYDYIIADAIIAPVEHRPFFSEKIVHLPWSYQANDSARAAAGAMPARCELELPDDAFVFCCFNNNYKILPDVFDLWMRILARAPGSVLWLLEDNAAAKANLKREATARGIDAQRLVFARRATRQEHLARHLCADLFLDTLPYNAHSTASDALWAGLPVLTCRGDTFAGRVAASLLGAIGLTELITENLETYESLAVALARDPLRLAMIRQKIATTRATAPLFDTIRFTRGIEAAYEAMTARHNAGLRPDHISI